MHLSQITSFTGVQILNIKRYATERVSYHTSSNRRTFELASRPCQALYKMTMYTEVRRDIFKLRSTCIRSDYANRWISRPRRSYLWSSLTFIALINFTSGRRLFTIVFFRLVTSQHPESTLYHCTSRTLRLLPVTIGNHDIELWIFLSIQLNVH